MSWFDRLAHRVESAEREDTEVNHFRLFLRKARKKNPQPITLRHVLAPEPTFMDLQAFIVLHDSLRAFSFWPRENRNFFPRATAQSPKLDFISLPIREAEEKAGGDRRESRNLCCSCDAIGGKKMGMEVRQYHDEKVQDGKKR